MISSNFLLSSIKKILPQQLFIVHNFFKPLGFMITSIGIQHLHFYIQAIHELEKLTVT